MDKLQYDSFYKFLVSLGMLLITLPVAIVTRTFQERPDKYNILQFEFDTDQSCLLSVIQDIENENMVIWNDYTKNRKAEIICSI